MVSSLLRFSFLFVFIANYLFVEAQTNQFRGVNWADERDNFQRGVIYLSGLSSSDNYASASVVADRVIGQFEDLIGSNCVRLPINEATVNTAYWNTYRGAIDVALTKGKVILCFWSEYSGAEVRDMNAFWAMWTKVVDQYGDHPNMYFEVFNEPSHLNKEDLRTLYYNWLQRYPSFPQNRVILDGSGLAMYVPDIGSDSRFDNCLLAVHEYSFFGSTSSVNESDWEGQLRAFVGNYANRTVCTEWGGPMGPGTKSGVFYEQMDYSQPPTNFFEAYMRGISNQLREWGMGSFYWPGLRDGDWYSLTQRTGEGENIQLNIINQSGLDRVWYSWGDYNQTQVTITQPTSTTFLAPATIPINATATKTGGTISKVEFYNGTTKLGEDLTSPYSYTWANVDQGSYTITAVAIDNEGNTTEDEITIRVNVPQGPYEGTVHPIPGTIQLEHFDVGGNGFAYFDDTPGSETDVEFRTDEDVDIENCTDAGGGYNLGWTAAGEWLEYTVNVETPGIYDLSFRAAVDGADRTVSLSMDGEAIATDVAIPNTTGWQVWQTVTVSGITLLPGEKIMRLTIGATDYVNLNYVTFTLTEEFVQEPFHGTPHSIPGIIQAQDYDKGGEGLGYHEANANGNEGGATYRTDEVDIEATQDTDGDYNIGYTLTGEWLEYTVNVLNSGNYDLDIRVAKDGDGGLFHIEMDGEDVTGAIEVPNTGGWQVWETVRLENLTLTAGEHIMRIVFDTDYTNLNYVQVGDLVTGNNHSIKESFHVYPNPFSGGGLKIDSEEAYHYTLTNISGVVVKEGGSTNKSEEIGTGLTKGTYFLTIYKNSEVKTIKVVKQ